jgi:hypothetical protein
MPAATGVAEAAFAGALGEGDVEYLQGMLLRSDEDGLLFVNYLALPAVFEQPDEVVVYTVEKHRDALRAGLSQTRHEPRNSAKWVWAVDYHNFVVSYLGTGASTQVPAVDGLGFGFHTFSRA